MSHRVFVQSVAEELPHTTLDKDTGKAAATQRNLYETGEPPVKHAEP